MTDRFKSDVIRVVSDDQGNSSRLKSGLRKSCDLCCFRKRGPKPKRQKLSDSQLLLVGGRYIRPEGDGSWFEGSTSSGDEEGQAAMLLLRQQQDFQCPARPAANLCDVECDIVQTPCSAEGETNEPVDVKNTITEAKVSTPQVGHNDNLQTVVARGIATHISNGTAPDPWLLRLAECLHLKQQARNDRIIHDLQRDVHILKSELGQLASACATQGMVQVHDSPLLPHHPFPHGRITRGYCPNQSHDHAQNLVQPPPSATNKSPDYTGPDLCVCYSNSSHPSHKRYYPENGNDIGEMTGTVSPLLESKTSTRGS